MTHNSHEKMSSVTADQFLEACNEEDLFTMKQYIDSRLPSNFLTRFLHDWYYPTNDNILTCDLIICDGLTILIQKNHLAGVFYISDRCKISLRDVFNQAVQHTSWKIIRHVLQIYEIPEIDPFELYSFDIWYLLEKAVEHFQDDIVTLIENHMIVDVNRAADIDFCKMFGAIKGHRLNIIFDHYHLLKRRFFDVIHSIIFKDDFDMMNTLIEVGFEECIVHYVITRYPGTSICQWCFKRGLFHNNKYIDYLKHISTSSYGYQCYYFAKLIIQFGTTLHNITKITIDIFNHFNQDIFFDYLTQRSLMILALEQGCDVNKCLWVECVPRLLKKRSARCASILICLHHKLDKYVINEMIGRQIEYD